MRAANLNRRGGFTMMEMVLVIVILGIIGASFGMFILPALNANQAVERRAALIDSAELALRRMARDIRISLPNSLRISSVAAQGFAIEMLPTLDGGRYCVPSLANCSGAAQELDLTAADANFDIVGCFHNAQFTGATFPSTAFRLVVGDATGQVYSASGSPAVITPAATTITLSTVDGGGSGSGACGNSSGPNTSFRHHIALSAAHQFSSGSGRQRVFVVQTPVTYICNIAAGTLTRYYNYPIAAAAPTPSTPPVGGTSALVTDKIQQTSGSCSVTSTTTSVQTNGYVTLTVTLTNGGESAQLFTQVQLDNTL